MSMLAMLAAVCAFAQEPAGVIEVNVRDAISRAPLAEARLTLRGAVNRSGTTSAGGSFRFEQLAPGEYEVSVAKPGYVDSSKGGVRQTVRLKPGGEAEAPVLDLTPLGAMEGAVLDENGRPLAGVSVTVAGVSSVTGKDGRFVFEDLVPDAYRVSVNVPHEVRSGNLLRDESSGDYYGYAPAQYYPGSDDARLAIPVTVPAGARLRNIDLRLRRTLLVEFSGRLLEMTVREPIANAEVQLSGQVGGAPDPKWARHPAGVDGTFRFSLLQPGTYFLAVFRADRSPLPYVTQVEIGKAGADDMPLVIPPFGRVEGKLIPRDPETKWTGSASVRLRHRLGIVMSAESRPDGSFAFESVPPGEFTVSAQLSNIRIAGDRTRRFSVKGIRFGSQTDLQRPITVAEAGNPPLEMLLTDEPSGIAGKVIGDATVSRFPFIITVADAEGRRSIATMTMASSDFQIPDVPPGEYQVTAWRSSGTGGRMDFSRTCEETIRVTVRQGSVSNVTLRPCP